MADESDKGMPPEEGNELAAGVADLRGQVQALLSLVRTQAQELVALRSELQTLAIDLDLLRGKDGLRDSDHPDDRDQVIPGATRGTTTAESTT
ncbi:MAG: hypothetical protein PHR35_12645, partial [Kiritimatiellae bacterium]|nr:hypothetical protein [Kiritimatiellia bacterium]